MLTVIIPNAENDLRPLWLDLFNPTPEDLRKLTESYKIPSAYINDCLNPTQLPKYEKVDGVTLIVSRSYDDQCLTDQDTVQSMTRKLTLILGDRFLISIHRKQQNYLDFVFQSYSKSTNEVYLQKIMLEILLSAIETYHFPLEEAETEVHKYEHSIFKNQGDEKEWERIFITKTRLTVIKRMLWHTHNSVQKFVPFSDANRPMCQDLTERIESLIFFTDGLIDNLNNLLNIQISLSSHNTNRIMRVLTLFSAIFMPLTFIVGVYGMNFRKMPELEWKYGYLGAWVVITITAVGIIYWFKKNKWIR